MVFIKIKNSEGTVISVEAVSDESWAMYQQKNDLIIRCPQQEAEGIYNFNGSKVYQLADRNEIHGEDVVPGLTAAVIPEWEYDNLLNEIEAPAVEELEELAGNETPEEKVFSNADLYLMVSELRDEVDTLKQGPIQDEATTRFYQTLSDSSTNSIAKIRAAAQQYLDDTSSTTTEEEGGSDV